MTERQVQILDMLAEGKSRRYISKELHLSEQTVARDYQSVLRRLDDLRVSMGRLYFAEQLARWEYLWDKLTPKMDKGDIDAIVAGKGILSARDQLLDLSPRQGHGGGDTSYTIIYNGLSVDASELQAVRTQQLARLPDPNVIDAVISERAGIARWYERRNDHVRRFKLFAS